MSIVKMRRFFASGVFFRALLLLIAATFVIGGVWVGFGMAGAGGGGPRSRESNLIAKVNGDKISRKDFAMLLDIRSAQQEQTNAGAGAMQGIVLRGQVLDELIENRLRVQAAESKGVRVGRRDVSKEIDKLVEQRVDQLRNQVLGEGHKKGPAADRLLDRRLKQLDPADSLKRRTQAFEAQFPRQQVWEMLVVQKLQDKLKDDVKLSDQALRDSFKQVTARHILIGTQARPEAQAKRRADEVLKKVQGGADFASLASQYSDDPGSKRNGGMLPAFGHGMMVPEFEKAAFALKPGQVSGLVKTQFGYHIIKVEGAKYALPPDFEKKRSEYRAQILLQRRSEAAGEFFNKLREKASIVVYEPDLKGYLTLRDAARAAGDKAAYQKKLAEAAAQYESAIRQASSDNPDWMAMVMLSQVRLQQGKKDEAISIMRRVLVENLAEGADLRIMLGRLYLENGDKPHALEQFLEAADVGYGSPQIHAELAELFKQVGRSDLAKKEQDILAQLMERQQQLQREGGMPPGQPMPVPGG